VAVRAIILDGDKLLCQRLKQYDGRATGGGAADYWCTPGGGLDIGEPLVAALEREVIEETGIKPVVGQLLYVQQFQFKDTEHLELFFHVTNGKDYRHINLDQTSHGATEVEQVDFVDPKAVLVKPTFLSQVDILADAQRGQVQVFNMLS
jgi:ADP-ribose pyrophosphatase YjhB (NUDIX family)